MNKFTDGLSRLPPVRLKSGLSGRQSPEPNGSSHAVSPPIPPPETPTLQISTELVTSPTTIPTLVIESEPDAETVVPLPLLMEPSDTESSLRPISPPHMPATPISGDILLPILIFSVVKSNPPHLVSHLLYTQRFRNQNLGEGGYCLINLMAVAEFLENVDLAALGLGEGRVMRSDAFVLYFYSSLLMKLPQYGGFNTNTNQSQPSRVTVDAHGLSTGPCRTSSRYHSWFC